MAKKKTFISAVDMYQQKNKSRSWKSGKRRKKNQGCYVATCVYGSYDCPEVWTLRRFRDEELSDRWYGRCFIAVYYKLSPIIVKMFGKQQWFTSFVKKRLDKMVSSLQKRGVASTKYQDLDW